MVPYQTTDPLVSILREEYQYHIYIAGVRVMTYAPNEHGDGGIFVRRVIGEGDVQRLRDAQVRVPVSDCRVVVF